VLRHLVQPGLAVDGLAKLRVRVQRAENPPADRVEQLGEAVCRVAGVEARCLLRDEVGGRTLLNRFQSFGSSEDHRL
jgi:hypothetical protein